MSRPTHTSPTESGPHTLTPAGGGWHCSHLYYSFERAVLKQLTTAERGEGSRALLAALNPTGDDAPIRLQSFIVSGTKADFGLMLLDPDPLKVDRVHQRVMASQLGPAIVPRWSFVSMTEISEYVQAPEQFGERLVAEGMDTGSAEYQTRVKAYAGRLVDMNRQRLTPDFPAYRAMCFYPMNKKRKVGENWFTLAKEERSRLMIEHARSGMAFAGRVSQLITVGVGLEDWEWGVTLWAANPAYLKEIVYRMRFDEASARYAEFGPFYTGYVATAAEILDHCQITT
jgi:hydrogen peroxide-dependent heme synthase